MNVIEMSLEIVVVFNRVLPKPALPDTMTTVADARLAHRLFYPALG